MHLLELDWGGQTFFDRWTIKGSKKGVRGCRSVEQRADSDAVSRSSCSFQNNTAGSAAAFYQQLIITL